MKLEYLSSSSADTPLIRLFHFDKAEASQLQSIFASLATRPCDVIDLTELPFIEPVHDCRLSLTVGDRDLGVEKIQEPATFVWSLTPESWDNVAGLVEPFASTNSTGFQWLNEQGVALVLSVDGGW